MADKSLDLINGPVELAAQMAREFESGLLERLGFTPKRTRDPMFHETMMRETVRMARKAQERQ